MSNDKVPKIKPKQIEKRLKETHSKDQISDKTKFNQRIQNELLPSSGISKSVEGHITAECIDCITAQKISEDTVKFCAGGKETLKSVKKDIPTIFIQE